MISTVVARISSMYFGYLAFEAGINNNLSKRFLFMSFFTIISCSVGSNYLLWDLNGIHDLYLLMGVSNNLIH